MHPVVLEILVACLVCALTWLAAIMVGLWLALLGGIGGFAAYVLWLYYNEHAKFPWQP